MDAPVSHVLARKYRSQVFDDLIGQEALVRTITNAIASGRLAHAYMLTGIRGVGKTSSARIIAKGLNCIGEDGKGGMTPNPCGKCRHCVDIANDAHIDVIEIDAASNTGVDNVREIIEGAKYNPVSARFKIYIIDEVHMLSRQAFNALLKTLEEPPERIKFIFATTEIRKVPVTILSRCQRFDLRRVDEQTLMAHLAKITNLEGAKAEEEALHLLAKAGDGSVRDSLSLLDQAITQFDGDIHAEQIRQMLGVADRTSLFDLYAAVMQGNIAKSLELLGLQYECGADPLVIAQDMLELTHWLTRIKIVPDLLKDVTVPEAERVRGKEMSDNLSMGALTAVWQMLLKGILEVKQADYPLKALEMLIIRLAYAADMPTPAQIIEDIKKNTIAQNSASVGASVHTQASVKNTLYNDRKNEGAGGQPATSIPAVSTVNTTQDNGHGAKSDGGQMPNQANVGHDAAHLSHVSEMQTLQTSHAGADKSIGNPTQTAYNNPADGWSVEPADGITPIHQTAVQTVRTGSVHDKDSKVIADSKPYKKPADAASPFARVQADEAPHTGGLNPAVQISSIKDMAKLARENKEMLLAFNIENHIRPIEISNGKFVCAFTDDAPDHLSMTLAKFLSKATGMPWSVETRASASAKTQNEVKQEKREQELAKLKQDPLVAGVLNAFKGAKIEAVKATKVQDFVDEPDMINEE